MSNALDRFFEHYYRRRPVNATFTGVHAHDALLPDWSPAALAAMDDEMRAVWTELAVAHPMPASAPSLRDDADLLDAELARGFLEIQLAENAGTHGMRGNPALWTGEAVFSVIALMIRDFAPLDERIAHAASRLDAIPAFLEQAVALFSDSAISPWWTAKAQRDCAGAMLVISPGLDRWLASGSIAPDLADRLRQAGKRAGNAFERFSEWLAKRPPAGDSALACGPDMYDLLLARGHQSTKSRGELLADARAQFAAERVRLDSMVADVAGSWSEAQEQLAAAHPVPEDYLDTFAQTWNACRRVATDADVVTWPDWPIRYVPFPESTRDAAPFLYYLYYRAPAPFDPYTVYDYVVPPLSPDGALAEGQLRAWNNSVIKLNHVVHHGAIGHHVQNWHAYRRASSRVGKVAAVDCANRIGMFCGGSMAEGWACYATGLMEELGFLTPMERVSEQHSRVRFLARAIVDIELHQGTLSFADAVRFYVEQVGMSLEVARAEAVKNSMYPCTAVMYWLGTQGIVDLRERVRAERGSDFSLKEFHDELLGFGSVPVPLVARIMEGR